MTAHASGRVRLTRGKGDVVCAIYLAEDLAARSPQRIEVSGVSPGAKVTLPGSPDASLAWEPSGDEYDVFDPHSRWLTTVRLSRDTPAACESPPRAGPAQAPRARRLQRVQNSTNAGLSPAHMPEYIRPVRSPVIAAVLFLPLATATARAQAAAQAHADSELAAVAGEHNAGGHRLRSFATYLTMRRGLAR